MPTNRIYHTWIQKIRELHPGQRIMQVRNFVWLMIGIYESRSIVFEPDRWENPRSGKTAK
jgi:hypothetical protein